MSKKKIKVLAVLQNAYTTTEDAIRINKIKPLRFIINPRNLSGRKLYSLLTENMELWVTNVCPEWFDNAKQKGKTDMEHVEKAVFIDSYNFYIVGGKQAKEAVKQIERKILKKKKSIIYMPHPAQRFLTKELLDDVRKEISNMNLNTGVVVYTLEYELLKGEYRKEVKNAG